MQVPEDLQSILTDSSLHNGAADITTKEILTRYGDIAKGHVQSRQSNVQGPDAPAHGPLSATNSHRSNGPVATRVDVDQSQANAWQKQSSIKHVQNVNTNASQGLPSPQPDVGFSGPNSPYARDRSGSQGSSQASFGQPGGRSSYQPRPRRMGVTG